MQRLSVIHNKKHQVYCFHLQDDELMSSRNFRVEGTNDFYLNFTSYVGILNAPSGAKAEMARFVVDCCEVVHIDDLIKIDLNKLLQ